MKKAIALLLAAVLLCGLTACSKNTAETSADETTSDIRFEDIVGDENQSSISSDASSETSEYISDDGMLGPPPIEGGECDHFHNCTSYKESTCKEEGSATYTCIFCGDHYTEKLAKKEHDFSKIETEPTCTEDGYVDDFCFACGEQINETLKATGHKWKDATCTEAKTCTKCDATEGEKLGHTTISGTCSRCKSAVTLNDIYSLSYPRYMPVYLSYSVKGVKSGTFDVTEIAHSFDYNEESKKVSLTIEVKVKCGSVYNIYDTFDPTLYYKCVVSSGDDYRFEKNVSILARSGRVCLSTIRIEDIEPGDYSVSFANA